MNAGKKEEDTPGTDRAEEFFHSHAIFADRADEEKICGRALKTLYYLCPEVAWISSGSLEFEAKAKPENMN